MTNRILIDVRAGVLEIEGEKVFIEAQLERLLPLVESSGFGTPADEDEVKPPTQTPPELDTSNDVPAKGKRSRRGNKRPPKGQSCADRMMTLREDGYFKDPQTPSQIVAGLAQKGWTHNTSQVAAAGLNMFNRGDIQRTKSGKGYQYYWDRD